jgi:AraC-like DNA-binding protein
MRVKVAATLRSSHHRYYENQPIDGRRHMLSDLLMSSMIMDFPAIDLKNKTAFESEPNMHVNSSIWRCVRWLEERYAQRICIRDLALRAGLSPRHFARSFLKATGYTPHKYLLRLRLIRARELMTPLGQAVCLKQIAESCGFYDQAHFGRHFRRMFATTPAEFLRAQQLLQCEAVTVLSYGRNIPNFVRIVKKTSVDSAAEVG